MKTSRCSRAPGAGPARGFVLVAVLVALTVISMLAAAVAVVSARAVAEAQADADAFQAEIDAIGTRDTVLYLLATQRQTIGGLTVDRQVVYTAGQATASPQGRDEFGAPVSRLPIGNEIRLDATPYVGLGRVGFALQDDGGLASINWTSQLFRPGMLRMLGAPPDRWNAMEAARLDYQDPDSLYRLGGAEAEQYRERGLPPPSNRALATPLEARRILGWGEALEGMDDARLMRLLTLSRSVAININTATVESLQVVPGVDRALAERIVALREATPFLLGWRFIREFGLPLDEMAPISLAANGYGTLALWHNAGPRHVVHWTLTPMDAGGRPWRLDYEITLPRDDVTDSSLARPTASPLLPGPAAAGR
jgi:general secretion pathway protein K